MPNLCHVWVIPHHSNYGDFGVETDACGHYVLGGHFKPCPWKLPSDIGNLPQPLECQDRQCVILVSAIAGTTAQ